MDQMDRKRRVVVIATLILSTIFSISILLNQSPNFYTDEIIVETEIVPKPPAQVWAAWLLGILGAAMVTICLTGIMYVAMLVN